MDSLVDRRDLSRLRWRCRRGLLENDLLIERFFARHARAALMELGDNVLLDLLLGRTEPAPPLASDEVRQVLALLRPRGAADDRDPAIESLKEAT